MVTMTKHIEYTKTIERLERLRSSTNGNPRYLIHFTDGTTAKTQSDSMVAYGLENRENIGVPVLVKATPAGMVWGVTPVE